MRFLTAGTIAACIAAASAFKDTSPYFLFSNIELPSNQERVLSPINQLASAASVENGILQALALKCPSVETVLVVEQPNANAADYASPTSAPHLRKALKESVDGGPVFVSLSVAEVAGVVDTEKLMRDIGSKLSFEFRKVEVYGDAVPQLDLTSSSSKEGADIVGLTVKLRALSSDPVLRLRELAYNDILLQELLAQFKGRSYIVVYATTPITEGEASPVPHGHGDAIPHPAQAYEAEFQEPLHNENKRQTGVVGRAANSTRYDRRPLFEKYQFFTPGLFMGLLVTLLLLAILSVGIRAISSLEVSYAAFEKEMGPAAHRKAQ